MNMKETLIKRLNDIAAALKETPHALALLGLGSAGLEIDRMDQYSDLDFFVICEEGFKNRFIEELDWLVNIYPVSFIYKNTKDGYKLMFEDGVFCEFAVFEPQELINIPFSEGRIIWRVEKFNPALCIPRKLPEDKSLNIEWLIGETLGNLYVGLCRYRRGEKLSAFNFIQGHAKDKVLQLISLVEVPELVKKDSFSIYRRFEFRYPKNAGVLSDILAGYDSIPEAAEAILGFLETNFSVNGAMKNRILELIGN